MSDKVTRREGDSIHRIVYEPYGVAAAITPWNFPFGMCVWGTIPNLVAGNIVILKVSEECPLIGKLFEEVMNSNLPEGVFSEVYGAGDIGQKLAESDINLIWFTGSTRVGKTLYKIAAEKFIKVILEMGGSNPSIVFEDVDASEMAPQMYIDRFYNCGQVCDAIKRLIVHESIFDNVVEEVKKILDSKKFGDPTNEETRISSLVAQRQVDLIKEQVKDALDKGAKMAFVKDIPQGLEGAFYPPTILTNVTRDMRVWKEEVFGPVLPIVKFKTEEQAIELANDTPYGLGSRVFTKDSEKAERVAAGIEAGTVEINNASRWLSCNPFGGYKESGMGREHGIMGFRELCQVKVISK